MVRRLNIDGDGQGDLHGHGGVNRAVFVDQIESYRTMSEAELHVLRARMREGCLHKAAKGELRVALPVGYEYDAAGQVRIAADEAVADAVANVFAYFEQLASARQVLLGLLAEGRRLPRPARRRGRPVRWVAPTYKAVYGILTNPAGPSR